MPISNGFASRTVVVSRNDEVVAGIRTKTVTFEGEPIDVTTDENDGWRTLIPVYGTRGMTLAVDGVVKSNLLKTTALSQSNIIEEMVVEWPDGYTVTGDFAVASYSENGSHDGEMTFSCEFRSTGALSYEEPVS